MAIYGGTTALSPSFRAPREGSHQPPEEPRISMGPDPIALEITRRRSAGTGMGSSRVSRVSSESVVDWRGQCASAWRNRWHLSEAERDAISQRRMLYRELAERHRHMAHLWSQAASLAHARSREAFANGQPAAALYDAGLRAEAECAFYLKSVNALTVAMRATYLEPSADPGTKTETQAKANTTASPKRQAGTKTRARRNTRNQAQGA